MPSPSGFDLRNFECDRYYLVVTWTVVNDPMKSEKVRWLAGELKPPK
jgi:hypothetical protein